MPDKAAKTSPPARGISPGQWLPWVIFSLLLGGGLGLYIWREHALAVHQAKEIEQRQQNNAALGLPRDYPLDLVPLYEGVTVDKAERKDSKSTDGRPMDQWHVHAETDTSKDVVFPFYNKLLLDKGFQQTMYASVPSGYGVTFANESVEVQFTIEKKRNDKRTQLDIILSRIQAGAPPPANPPAGAAPPAPIPIQIKPQGAPGAAAPGNAGTPPAAPPGSPPSSPPPAAPSSEK